MHTVAPVISKSSCWKQTAPKLHKKGVNVTGRLKDSRWNTHMHLAPAAEVAGAAMILQGDDTLGNYGAVWALSLDGTVLSTLWVTPGRVKGHRRGYIWWRDSVSTADQILLLRGGLVSVGHPADINLYCCMLRFYRQQPMKRWAATGRSAFMLLMQANTGAWPLGGPLPPSVWNIYLFTVINPFSLSILLECFCRIP